MIIDGKALARRIIEELKKIPKPEKSIAAVLVGENPASESFLKQKKKVADELGVDFRIVRLDESISEGELAGEIKHLGADKEIGGVLVQLPLPKKFNREAVLAALNPTQDIDALSLEAAVAPLAVEVVKDILSDIHYQVEDKVIGVVGRGILIGVPVAEWLFDKCLEVIIFHTGTDLSRIKDCDLIISGAGKAGLIKPATIKAGAGFIDFGFDMKNGKIAGDLDTSDVKVSGLSFYTPTPGGTGPMLVAEIFKNFYRLNSPDGQAFQ